MHDEGHFSWHDLLQIAAEGPFMKNRELIAREYFQLRVMLNKTNLQSNQKTDVDFRIAINGTKRLSLYATLKRISRPAMLELCFSERQEMWRPSGFSGLFYLENFCADFINSGDAEDRARPSEKRMMELKQKLSSLGIAE